LRREYADAPELVAALAQMAQSLRLSQA